MKDLSARLPYEVIVNIEYSKEHGSSYRLRVCSEGDLKLNTDLLGLFIQEEIYLKPYLRPMSSMTEEEIKELSEIDMKRIIFSSRHLTWHLDGEVIDYLNKKMFDWRGLIHHNLALKAPKEMYNLK